MRRLLAAALLLGACKPSEVGLARRLEAANTCEVPEDCVDLGSVCPFGCNLLVNVDKADDLRKALASFTEDGLQTCTLDCETPTSLDCDRFECVPVFSN